MKTHEDIVLLGRLKSGDIHAYEQLFIKYYKLLTIEAFALLEDEMEAEDQEQSLFVEIWPGVSVDEIKAKTAGKLIIEGDIPEMKL